MISQALYQVPAAVADGCLQIPPARPDEGKEGARRRILKVVAPNGADDMTGTGLSSPPLRHGIFAAKACLSVLHVG